MRGLERTSSYDGPTMAATTISSSPEVLPYGKVQGLLTALPIFQGQKSGFLCEKTPSEKAYNYFKNKTHPSSD